jgi:hypothetical protein
MVKLNRVGGGFILNGNEYEVAEEAFGLCAMIARYLLLWMGNGIRAGWG